MRKLRPEPLTAKAFAPFGQVIEAGPGGFDANYGAATRFPNLADIDVAEGGGRVAVGLFRARPLPKPMVLAVMERHPLGSQAFVPLQGRPYLVAVAPAGDLDADRIALFRAGPCQGVNYRRGVWHHFLLALEAESDFLVIDREGPGLNLDEVRLDAFEQVEVAL
jgi:ureidoglycolate lyase